MAKNTKVVVTRNLIDDAQQILEAESSIEIVQWKSDQVRRLLSFLLIVASVNNTQ